MMSEVRLASRALDGTAQWETERTPLYPWVNPKTGLRHQFHHKWIDMHKRSHNGTVVYGTHWFGVDQHLALSVRAAVLKRCKSKR
jgi:hypothetical protein